MCAAGAAILNQWAERRYDALMPRTANRPLPTGRILPGKPWHWGCWRQFAGGFICCISSMH